MTYWKVLPHLSTLYYALGFYKTYMNYQKVGPRKEKDTITRISINMLSSSFLEDMNGKR